MRNQYKILAEKYQVIQENIEKPTLEVLKNGDKVWRQSGLLHRLDGPAYERLDGTKVWYQKGKRHRLDGPAAVNAKGTKEWYIYGIELTEDDFNKWKWKHDQHETLKKASAETGIELDI